jgi:glucose 1-dehydrogenase
MDKMLQDKIAIVTGASSGIGRAIAVRFASEEARVIKVVHRPSPSSVNLTMRAILKQRMYRNGRPSTGL